jgi:hypothetical protein
VWVFPCVLKKKNSVVWVRERTIPTERPPLVGKVIANFCFPCVLCMKMFSVHLALQSTLMSSAFFVYHIFMCFGVLAGIQAIHLMNLSRKL